jgi:hypothetical protein
VSFAARLQKGSQQLPRHRAGRPPPPSTPFPSSSDPSFPCVLILVPFPQAYKDEAVHRKLRFKSRCPGAHSGLSLSLYCHMLLLDLSTYDTPSSCVTFKGFARYSNGRGPFPSSCTMDSSHQYTFYHTAPSASMTSDGGPTTYLKTMSSDASNTRSIYFPLRLFVPSHIRHKSDRVNSRKSDLCFHTQNLAFLHQNDEKAFLDENHG